MDLSSLPKELQPKKSSGSKSSDSYIAMFDKAFGTGDHSSYFPRLDDQLKTDPHGAAYRVKRAQRCRIRRIIFTDTFTCAGMWY